MNEVTEQERLDRQQELMDMNRVKEIYNDALFSLMNAAMPIQIKIKRRDALRISASIIQENHGKIIGNILIYVFAVESGNSPSNYLANMYIDSGKDSIEICSNVVVKYYELPAILEKSCKVELVE